MWFWVWNGLRRFFALYTTKPHNHRKTTMNREGKFLFFSCFLLIYSPRSSTFQLSLAQMVRAIEPDPQPPLATQPLDEDANNEDDDGGAIDGTVWAKLLLRESHVCLFIHFFRYLLTGFFFLSLVPRLSRNVTFLAGQLGTPELPDLVRHFLYQRENPDLLIPLGDVPLDVCPTLFGTKACVYHDCLIILDFMIV